ncbi:DJ-1/PfpI family protein [Cellulomonas bogoriensis]|uniref:Thiamine biosynthesis protein ThiJ n=1 Tax=Cellulomonas bogoriensis 69B4 = DSM 16987 TaxID=1386082 RepID=A0A0A0BSP1_9CELL|nr:DJ-1/PfpI family protein [Cellulomonas bogoriensis]KGM10940.1 thiamine biosynthesis protein ThiJ [Cellulomonas bogoriensis 69B4 = DSM 16987]
MTSTSPVRVGVVVFDGADELDVVGPYAVLRSWVAHSSLHPEVVTVSADGRGVVLARGLKVVPDRSAADVTDLHVVIQPGGPGVRTLLRDRDHVAWLRETRRRTAVLAGVGSGTLVLAAAGALAGRPVAASRAWSDDLVRIEPSVLVDTEGRLVDDGDVLTAAGGASSTAAGLHLVGRLESEQVADAVRSDLGHPGRGPGVDVSGR